KIKKKEITGRNKSKIIRCSRDDEKLKSQKKRQKSKIFKTRNISEPRSLDKSEFNFEDVLHKSQKSVLIESNVVVIGASVGGPRTITQILRTIPSDFTCPILIVQHLTNQFVDVFVSSLNENCALNVKIAEDGKLIEKSTVYIAPGNYHLSIATKNCSPIIKLFQGPPVHFCIPSIDVLFSSAARIYQEKVLAILLTGMGKDGVKGMGMIKKYGGRTIAEAKETSILYGMPKSAVKKGYAELILPNYEIADYLNKYDKYITLSSRY
ncbi:MAG: hypothetical protein GF383_12735, partial [Candidatus Lokiarchaeota archaeon]|nr:hypothetical protein [Candidatus Lokiarchaeota archaeon]MBD3341929.1 hypothetical protein [Candidatus Lokiarchaeota archaeon]